MTEWIALGPVSAVPRRGARCITTPGGKIAVFRTADDQIYAIENRCPHKGGPLAEGIVHGRHVTCPLHNWVFDLATGECVEAAEHSVRAHAVRADDGRVFVSLAPSA